MTAPRRNLTDEEKERYVENQCGSCPYCGGSRLEGDSYTSDSDAVTQQIRCLTCERAWTDVYTLSGIEEEAVQPQPDDDYCPVSEGHCHELDFGSLEVARGYNAEAEQGIVFTVACRHCKKRCGAGKVHPTDIEW